MKTIKVSSVVYEMLLELSKERRAKLDLLVETIVKEKYIQARK